MISPHSLLKLLFPQAKKDGIIYLGGKLRSTIFMSIIVAANVASALSFLLFPPALLDVLCLLQDQKPTWPVTHVPSKLFVDLAAATTFNPLIFCSLCVVLLFS